MFNNYSTECILALSQKQKDLANYITSLMLQYPMFTNYYQINKSSLKHICIDVTKSEDPHAIEQMASDIIDQIHTKLFEDPDFNNSRPYSLEKVEYFRLTSCSIIIEYFIKGN
jgi:hypothetical protein